MRTKLPASIVLITSVFALGGVVSAHVVVTPKQVNVAEFQTFDISVPNEKDSAVTSLKLLVPPGLAEVSPTVKPGWQINVQRDSKDNVTEIDWTGGSIPKEQRDDFTFNAQAPTQAGELDWKAYQTYADGSQVSWDQKPAGSDDATGNTGPYSVTKVINDFATQSNATTTTKTSNNNWSYVIPIAALALSVAALAKTTIKKQ